MRKPRWIAAALLPLMLCLLAACGPDDRAQTLAGGLDGSVYASEAAGVEIRFPQGWEVNVLDEAFSSYLYECVAASPDDTGQEAVSLSFYDTRDYNYGRAYETDGGSLTAREHVDNFMGIITPALEEGESLTEEPIHIAGQDRILVRFLRSDGTYVAYVYGDAVASDGLTYVSSVMFLCEEAKLDGLLEACLFPYAP